MNALFKKKKIDQRRSPQTSQPASVFSYYSSRSTPDAARARYEPPATHKQGFERFKHAPTLIAAIVIVASLLYASVLDNQPRLQIYASESGRSLQRSEAVYRDFVAEKLSSSIFNKSKLTFNSQPLVESLKQQFPEVDSAVVTLPLLGHKPIVRVAVSSPVFILATSHGSYYVNDKGVPLVRVSDVQAQPKNVPVVTDESSLPVKAGKQVLPTDTVDFISELLEQLSATKTVYDSVTLPLEANEVQVKSKGVPYVVRFNSLQDARIQVGTLLAVTQRLKGQGVTPKEYIDVRVEERAYYK
jgi:hypothetical protein